jgi:hypothetical protein
MDACSAVSIETPVTQRTCSGVAPVYKSMGLHREQDHILFSGAFSNQSISVTRFVAPQQVCSFPDFRNRLAEKPGNILSALSFLNRTPQSERTMQRASSDCSLEQRKHTHPRSFWTFFNFRNSFADNPENISGSWMNLHKVKESEHTMSEFLPLVLSQGKRHK